VTETPRRRPYLYVTWITKLLSGEAQCWGAAWHKAHYLYEKVPDAPDRAEFFRKYNLKHDAIVDRRAEELRAEGWTVRVEDANKFTVSGGAGDVGGKPDIVALRGDDGALVSDAKSGKPRHSDAWQVRLYQFLLPMDWLRRVHPVRGEVERTETREHVVLEEGHVEQILDAVKRVLGPEPQPYSPSPGDCQYCDVKNCPERYEPPKEGGMW